MTKAQIEAAFGKLPGHEEGPVSMCSIADAIRQAAIAIRGQHLEYLTDGARHLICLPYSIENLHQMARELDIKEHWFHKDHYDIPKRRIAEIEAKCLKVTSQQIVLIARHGRTLV